MDIQTLQPQPALQPYIEFYYFICSEADDFKSIHYSFPHTINVVSIYEQADYRSELGRVEIYHDSKNDYLSLVQGKCQQPLRVELRGRTNRITIIFKPFALNQFIGTPLSTVMGNKSKQLLEWDGDTDYKNQLKKCFSATDKQEKIRHLEKFLLSKLKPLDFAPMDQAVALLLDFERNLHIDEILKQMNMSLRTFNRRFKEVIGVSPIEYRNIARFRHSMNNKLFNSQFKRLTDIGYSSNFYDQSYFNKIYKKLTGSNPTAFFKAIEKVADDKLMFQFLNK